MEIDPEQIGTAEQLVEQLGELYRRGGWSIHRLAEASGLSTGTVQAIVTGARGLPQTGTLKAFVTACGQQAAPWVAARGRAVKAAKEFRARVRVVNVPRVESTFVGRAEELEELTRALTQPPVAHVVHGLGGVGKSTLVAQWARTHLDAVEVAWWITADSPAAMETGLAGLAVAVDPGLAGQPMEALAAHAVSWLAATQGWLLVLDNVTDPRDVAPLLNRDLPGKVVMTSRLAEGWHRLGATVIQLDVLPENQAIDLLTAIAAGTDEAADKGLAGAADLVTELGCLPLAVEQAAAYLHQTRLTPVRYLEMLRDNPSVMYDQTGAGADGERSIARIWRISLDTLAHTPMAGRLLRTMAWWAPEAIPRTLFDPAGDAAEVTTALGDLAAYSMITLFGDSVVVHRLVQAVARTPDAADPHRQAPDIDAARDEATRLLHEVIPADHRAPADWPQWRALLPHIDVLASHASPATSTTTTARLLNNTGLFLSDQGDGKRAVTYHEQALATFERLLGTDHVNTLVSGNSLARAYEAEGRLERALSLFKRVLSDCERILGPDDGNTLATRNDLARVYMLNGDVARALPLFRRVLSDFEQSLGPDHRDTLTAGHNLAKAYMAAGNFARALPLSRHVLARFEQILGPDEPDTLTARYTLAHIHQSFGDLASAIPLFEQNLAAQERVLGPDHPTTLGSRNSLARSYLMVGDLTRAIPLFEETLKARERVLGHDHPHTLGSRGNLAHAYESDGRLGSAIRLYKLNLADCERVLGTDHVLTRTMRERLNEAGE
ncbi:tetratricopeptide repeat protein [Actinomadura sp. B10D3]|uniref:tetratricopeptide repeat protein n=1 Tax=Actinomadura sp. B10D3 TaxID=3153557 RepID=UPI00325C7DF2